MAGSVHPVPTVELLVAPRHCGYVRAIDFDKFPDTGGLDPVAECRANIETIKRSRPVVATLAEDERLAQAAILLAPAVIGLLRNPAFRHTSSTLAPPRSANGGAGAHRTLNESASYVLT